MEFVHTPVAPQEESGKQVPAKISSLAPGARLPETVFFAPKLTAL